MPSSFFLLSPGLGWGGGAASWIKIFVGAEVCVSLPASNTPPRRSAPPTYGFFLVPPFGILAASTQLARRLGNNSILLFFFFSPPWRARATDPRWPSPRTHPRTLYQKDLTPQVLFKALPTDHSATSPPCSMRGVMSERRTLCTPGVFCVFGCGRLERDCLDFPSVCGGSEGERRASVLCCMREQGTSS